MTEYLVTVSQTFTDRTIATHTAYALAAHAHPDHTVSVSIVKLDDEDTDQ